MQDEFLADKAPAYVNAIRRTSRLMDAIEKSECGDELTLDEETLLYHRDPDEQTLGDLHKKLLKQSAALTALHQVPPY
jgi:hypothetical protein